MSIQIPPSHTGDPLWEIATLFPSQGEWNEAEYLALNTNRLVELNDGKLEFLPMPTELHQLIVFYLCTLLRNLNSGNPPGTALLSPFRVRMASGKFRQPDVMFMLDENRHRCKNEYWEGADLAIEVVSEDDPKRDLVTKRSEYAEAKISEYWIVNPLDRSIQVLTLMMLTQTEYRETGIYTDGQTAHSILLGEFQANVTAVFDQQR